MEQEDWATERFEANRIRLNAVAFRMLGSRSEADDAVQQAWLRLNRSDPEVVDNLDGWLTTVVARVCLDMLRSRASRREDPLDLAGQVSRASDGLESDPEQQALMADSVGIALLVVLDTLTPAERLAFVLHDLFAVPFDEIAPIVERSPAAVRQLASRARRRVQGASGSSDINQARRRMVVDAFFAASRGGDFAALIALLDPEVVLRADASAVTAGATPLVTGASAVAETFCGRAQYAQTTLVNGVVEGVWAVNGKPRVVFGFTIANDRVVAIELVADPEQLGQLDVQALPALDR